MTPSLAGNSKRFGIARRLCIHPRPQRRQQVRRDGDVADSGRGLGWLDDQLADEPHDRLPHVDDTRREVEVLDAKPAHLTGSQPAPAGQQQRHPSRSAGTASR